jgi:hypothetical protein
MNAIVQLIVKHGYSVLFASMFARQMWLPEPAILVLIAAGARRLGTDDIGRRPRARHTRLFAG